jgi:protease-4
VAARRGVVLVLVLIFLAIGVSAAGLLVMGIAVGRPTTITSNSTLLLDVSGNLLETEPGGVLGPFIEGPPTVRAVVDALRKAAVDRRVSSVVIRPTGTAALWGKVQEVRDAIIEFKQSKKPIVAYLESASDQSYYLASACDKVFLMPTASLDLTGMASYEIFLRGALDKIGVYPDSLHVGDYKTASNLYTELSFTPAHSEMS